jgi:hypothetical protein
VHAEEVAAETSVSVRASGASDGAGPRWGGDVPVPLPEENPRTANAAPLVADEAAEGADDESEDVQILPGPGDADDAEWMRGLVQALKEASPPSNAAAPYRSRMEYLYMGGGGAIERDAYDFIRFHLRMPEPDYGEPLKLWSWE